MIAAWMAGAAKTIWRYPSPSSVKFAIGTRVQVVNTTINVRESPGGTLLGTQRVGSLGTVLAGPTVTPNGVVWYQIDYDSGVDGWSGQDNLDNGDDDPTLPTVSYSRPRAQSDGYPRSPDRQRAAHLYDHRHEQWPWDRHGRPGRRLPAGWGPAPAAAIPARASAGVR